MENLSFQLTGNIEPTYRSNTVIPSILQVPITLHLHTGAVMQDLTVDQHSTQTDHCSTTHTEAPE